MMKIAPPLKQNEYIVIETKNEAFENGGIFAVETLECSLLKKIGRFIFIRFLNESKFEHMGVITKIHENYDKQLWISRFIKLGWFQVNKNTFYSIEATQDSGVTILPINQRLMKPSLLERKWGGEISFFPFRTPISNETLNEVSKEIKELNKARKQYSLVIACLNILPDYLALKVIKFFKLKSNPQNFCSALAVYILGKISKYQITKEEAQKFSPQEVIDFGRLNDLLLEEERLVKYDIKRGLVEYNDKYINIQISQND